jgi:hypothetical protein
VGLITPAHPPNSCFFFFFFFFFLCLSLPVRSLLPLPVNRYQVIIP